MLDLRNSSSSSNCKAADHTGEVSERIDGQVVRMLDILRIHDKTIGWDTKIIRKKMRIGWELQDKKSSIQTHNNNNTKRMIMRNNSSIRISCKEKNSMRWTIIMKKNNSTTKGNMKLKKVWITRKAKKKNRMNNLCAWNVSSKLKKR